MKINKVLVHPIVLWYKMFEEIRSARMLILFKKHLRP